MKQTKTIAVKRWIEALALISSVLGALYWYFAASVSCLGGCSVVVITVGLLVWTAAHLVIAILWFIKRSWRINAMTALQSVNLILNGILLIPFAIGSGPDGYGYFLFVFIPAALVMIGLREIRRTSRGQVISET
jgi:hypothetical protein